MIKTYRAKVENIKRNWHLFDAKDKVLGRLATEIAQLIIGKHKTDFSTNQDNGDYVVVINAEKIKLTGKKEEQKVYYSHSGHPGGFRETPVKVVRKEHPERILEHAVSGMLPDNRLKNERMKRFKVVAGDKNPYEGKFTKN